MKAMNVINKNHIFLITRNAVGLLMMGGIILCPVTMNAGVQYTHHDFSGATTWNPNEELCVVCHTPHHANTTVSPSPLWNHQVTTAIYTLYSSPTLDAVPTQPTSISKLCLSCHDGTVATDSFGGKTGNTFVPPQHYSPIGSIANPLKAHHPVAILYDSALATKDPKLYNPDITLSGLGGTISHDLLNGGVLECSSCHDVHVARKLETDGCGSCHATFSHLDHLDTKSLVKSNAASALCFTCHKK